MQTVTKEQFEAFLAKTITHSETDTQRDGEYAYEVWTNFDYAEVAQITYRAGEIVSYQIAEMA